MKYTAEILSAAVKNSTTWREVCERLGLAPLSGSQSHVKKRAIIYNIDFSHFPGQGWMRGKKSNHKKPLEYYYNTKVAKSHELRIRLIREGVKQECCEQCGILEWHGHPVPLELDHVNNNHFDNRLENLKIVCANCHANKKYTYGFVIDMGL